MIEFFTGTKEEKAARHTVKTLKQRERLSSGRQRDLLQAEKFSSRLFRRRLTTALVFIGAFAVSAFSIVRACEDQKDIDNLPGWLKIEEVDRFGKDSARQATSAAIEWDNRFKCGRSIVIRTLKNPQSIDLPGGDKADQEEESFPGIISIANRVNARDNVLHGMTHACLPDNPTIIDPPMAFSGGIITSYNGLKPQVTLHSGEQHTFPWFEEGMAERNASAFRGYSINNPVYEEIGSLTIREFPLSSESHTHEWAKNNDVDSFVRTKLKLPAGSPVTGAQIEQVMDEYQQAHNRGMNRLVQ